MPARGPLEDEVTAPRLEGRFEDGREIRSHAEREETRRLTLRLPRAQPDALPVPINPVPGELQGLRHTPARRFEELDHDAAVRGQLHEDRREVARVEEALSRVVQLGCWSGCEAPSRRCSSCAGRNDQARFDERSQRDPAGVHAYRGRQAGAQSDALLVSCVTPEPSAFIT